MDDDADDDADNDADDNRDRFSGARSEEECCPETQRGPELSTVSSPSGPRW